MKARTRITLSTTNGADLAALDTALRRATHDPRFRLWTGTGEGSLAVLVLDHLARRAER